MSQSSRKPPRKAEDYAVGYGKPPRSQQFGSPTRTGRVNTKGRPPKKAEAPTFAAELASTVTVTENGKKKTYTKLAIIHKQLSRAAMEGNLRAIKLALDYEASMAAGKTESEAFDIDPVLADKIFADFEAGLTGQTPEAKAPNLESKSRRRPRKGGANG